MSIRRGQQLKEPTKMSTGSPAADKGLSSKLLTMKFMRQAATKEQIAEAEKEQRRADDASKWTLEPPADEQANKAAESNVTVSGSSSPSTDRQITIGQSKVRILQGIGFQVIDAHEVEEGSSTPTGRKSWGKFNTQFDELAEADSDDSDGEEEEEVDEEEAKRRRIQTERDEENMMKSARKKQGISGAGGGGGGGGGGSKGGKKDSKKRQAGQKGKKESKKQKR
ncbi:hypothetical protein BZA70DRAFT_158962 [Myxozyma melibiosi]|uniref:Uncharacterized protein n=1 Tax=Myxozyma melibiosi TaxID=54550 RepID=A0ABR1F6I3_9ASCO